MSLVDQIKHILSTSDFVVKAYLQDLTDEDLMKRPAPNANHIAWQLGHLISSEHSMNNMVVADSMPALPEGFAEKHSKETASNDDPNAFCTKDEYLAAMETQRQGTLALLDRMSEEELEANAPEPLNQFAATNAALIAGQTSHWMMHAGQWVIVRRQLGKEALF